MIDATQERRLQRLLQSCGHNSHTHLYYLGDKNGFGIPSTKLASSTAAWGTAESRWAIPWANRKRFRG
ncbi:hypothetical protein HMSSN036_32090 [Paenibacillus macerans]|nr:hypothetical protein HMSSN036_32090 [Paenibacillus macerans]